jgi:hypothetical protein
MKRTAAATLLTLALCAAAAAQTGAPSPKPARARKAAPAAPGKSAAAEDEIERLFDRLMLAQGGMALLLVKSRVMRGNVEMSMSPAPASFESYEKMPGKSLVVIEGPGGQFIQASDGDKRWVKSPWAGVKAAGPATADPLSGGSPGAEGFKWRSLFSSARLKGRAVVDGRETVVLAATPRGREPLVMYFDAETGLLRKQEFAYPGGKEDKLGAVYIDSYATVDGVKVPALFRYVYPDFTMTFRVYEVKHNVAINDALFRDPNGK